MSSTWRTRTSRPFSPSTGWNGEAPLWFYILKEAEIVGKGRTLGPVGGRVVADAGSRLAALANIAADGVGTFGRAVNNAGVAVSWEFTQETLHAPLWLPSGGSMYAVEPGPCSEFGFEQADDINTQGSIAARGNRETARRLRAALDPEARGRHGGHRTVVQAVDAINDHEVLVGQQINNALKWSPTLGEVILGPQGTPGREICAPSTSTIATRQWAGEWQHLTPNPNGSCLTGADAMFWESNGASHTLERLPNDTHAIALGISDKGLIVGNSRSASVCNIFEPELQRAVIWHEGRIKDLNKLLKKGRGPRDPADPGQRHQRAWADRRVQLLPARPQDECWDFVLDTVTGEFFYDTSRTCHSIHAFLLTPKEGDLIGREVHLRGCCTRSARPLAAGCLLVVGIAWAQSPVQSCDSTPKPPFCSAVSGDRAQGWLTQHRSEVIARNGVVATSQSLAAQAGLDILKKGGNAIDAAVATAAMLSVVEPMNVGPAGDLFAIIYIAKENKLYSLNASGKAPSGATVARMKKLGYVWDAKNWGPGSGMPEGGILAVTVPGRVGLGRSAAPLRLAHVQGDAAAGDRLCRAGLSDFRAHRVRLGTAARVCRISAGDPRSCCTQLDPDSIATWYIDGKQPVAGQIHRNPGLAKTFRILQQQGRDGFYKGEIAQAIIDKSSATAAR